MEKLEIVKRFMDFIYDVPFSKFRVQDHNGWFDAIYITEMNNHVNDNKIKFVGDNRIVWGILGGRWREHEHDAVCNYSIENGKLIFTEVFKGTGSRHGTYKIE